MLQGCNGSNRLGAFVAGAGVGDDVGAAVGRPLLGADVGSEVAGATVGTLVGLDVGAELAGSRVGAHVAGAGDGNGEGAAVGWVPLGIAVGTELAGASVGCDVVGSDVIGAHVDLAIASRMASHLIGHLPFCEVVFVQTWHGRQLSVVPQKEGMSGWTFLH